MGRGKPWRKESAITRWQQENSRRHGIRRQGEDAEDCGGEVNQLELDIDVRYERENPSAFGRRRK